MTARDRILAAVTNELGARPAVGDAPVAPPRRLEGLDALPLRIDRFTERLATVHGELAWLPPGEDPLDLVAERLRRAGAQRVVLGGSRVQGCAVRLQRGLSMRGFHLLRADAPTHELMTADAGITDAQWGIAETGTVVLDDRRARARRASLLPPLHIAILDQRNLLPTLDDLFLEPSVRTAPPHALTLITGPSRTADIELQLVVGVHGPRELLVVLV